MIKVKEYHYGDGYYPKLFLDGTKIVDAQCKCKWGQVHKKAYKEGEKLCWHLVDSIREYYMEIKNKKQPKRKMLGFDKCPEWLKDAYRKAVDYRCEDCLLIEDECGKLEPHRIIQGYKGGTYRPGNVKMLCNKDHKKYAEEW